MLPPHPLPRAVVPLLLAVGWPAGQVVPAESPALAIELNKIESTDQGCRPVFVFENATGHRLNRLQIDLVLFDAQGVYAKQALLDMAPLHPGKKIVASFLFDRTPCAEIGSILVNGLPACELQDAPQLDCLGMLAVSSKAGIPLEK